MTSPAPRRHLFAQTAVLVCTATAMALAGCTSPTGSLPALAEMEAAPYQVAAGDKIHIAIQELQDASGDYVVEETGTISMPYVKTMPVAGLSYREIEQGIAGRLLSQGILVGQPVVNVRPIELRPFYVTGEVNRPGEFPYRHGMTVLAALSAAGGYTYRASTGKVSITRSVDGRDIIAKATETTPIQPGDRIQVFERWF
ncbi:MAG: polysaccharide biosynthesis/export family protein [Pseudomonadota bacterium]|nr:polysaccharide biosynthesis/export family protein [Pseudomonadota bacterium]